MHPTRFLAVLLLLGSTAVARAQVTSSGSLSLDGKRRLAKLFIRIGDAAHPAYPIAGVHVDLIGSAADTFALVTNGTGDASVWLPAGEYQLVTRDPVMWQGAPYRWSLAVTVGPALRDIVLTVSNAVPPLEPGSVAKGLGGAAVTARRKGAVPDRPVITAERIIEYPAGVRWRVFEETFRGPAITDLPAPGNATALMFDGREQWRQLDSYPANWRELPDSALVGMLKRARMIKREN